jgi:hypothetical protein
MSARAAPRRNRIQVKRSGCEFVAANAAEFSDSNVKWTRSRYLVQVNSCTGGTTSIYGFAVIRQLDEKVRL